MGKSTFARRRKATPFPLLVIEKDADQWLLIRSALARGFPEAEPVWVNNAAQAMTYLETASRNESSLPRLILVELHLPGREAGFGLLKTLKTHLLYRSIPLVVLSRSQQPTDIVESYGLGIASYIIKPVTTHRWLSCFYTFRRYWLESVALPEQRTYSWPVSQ